MAREPALDDDEIVKIISYGVGQAVGFSESKLSKERDRIQRYYDGEYPRKQSSGDSSYNARDVFDGVEDMHAQLLDTFSANKRPVKFDVAPGESSDAARIRTDYVNWVIFKQNNGYKFFSDTIKQGLLDRNAIGKVWWQPVITESFVYLSRPAVDEVEAYLAQHADSEPEITEMDMEEDDDTSIRRVQIKLKKKDKSQVRLALLAPEEFGISPMSEDIHTADMTFHRMEMTVSELLKEGYDKKDIEDLQSNDRLWASQEPEKIARFAPTDDLIGTRSGEDGQNAKRTIMVYEAYLDLDMDGEDTTQLYKVVYAGNKILHKEPIDRRPFVVFTPLPRPKAFWGSNYAELLIETQKARSYLTRGILRHMFMTNNPRMMVVKNAVVNPKELTDNRFGGIVNVLRPDGIIPLQQSNLNPFVFQTIAMLKQDKEEKTGISELSQGLDKNAVSKQNSEDMIHELITVSQMRQKIIARNFAENFLGPLYGEVYRLILENESREKMAKIAGQWINVDFSAWPEDSEVNVSFALGYGEQDKEAAKLAQVGQTLGAVHSLAPFFTPKQQYALAHDAISAMGFEDTNRYLAPFQEGMNPPPDPMIQAEIAMKQADAKVKEATAQAAVMKAQLETTKQQNEHEYRMAELRMKSQQHAAENQLKRDQLAHKVVVDAAEIKLQVAAQATDDLKAEAIPTR